MQERIISSAAVDRSAGPRHRRVLGRSRPLTAAQEGIFFFVVFALALCLQLAAALLHR